MCKVIIVVMMMCPVNMWNVMQPSMPLLRLNNFVDEFSSEIIVVIKMYFK